jgi:hypothetical protein
MLQILLIVSEFLICDLRIKCLERRPSSIWNTNIDLVSTKESFKGLHTSSRCTSKAFTTRTLASPLWFYTTGSIGRIAKTQVCYNRVALVTEVQKMLTRGPQLHHENLHRIRFEQGSCYAWLCGVFGREKLQEQTKEFLRSRLLSASFYFPKRYWIRAINFFQKSIKT